jgi:A/G-specific adenine glycosylase
LHKAARVVVAQWAGRLPDEETGLRKLPGIGAYTAAAVASIAYGERVAAVDGNLVRVLARLFALPGRASDLALIKAVRAEAQLLVDCQQPGDVNQALMDLGATLCLPEAPSCPACPLRPWCRAHAQGTPTAYPGKAVKAARQDLHIAFAWIERRGALLLEQRRLEGLWPGLWELPSASGPHADRDLATRLGQPLGPPLTRVNHELTHRHVTADVYPARATKQSGHKVAGQKWWTSPLTAPLSSLARKAILAAGKAIAGSTAKMS